MKRIAVLALGLLPAVAFGQARITGLANWNVVIDPGHSQNENVGIFGYSEAMKVLAEGLELRRLFLETTDIGAVYMTRTNATTVVGLTERTDYANSLGAAYFHSIHSDAGDAGANSTLVMYGGWRQNGVTVEKTPAGGKHTGGYLDFYLNKAMRIGARGLYADRTFYEGFPDNSSRFYPYLHVNRETIMASTLSEAGFHTNPTQNQRNMGRQWKRMEARALFYGFLKARGLALPTYRIVAGYATDAESGTPINGAVVALGAKADTTDTFEDTFSLLPPPGPTETTDYRRGLSNGFFYLEDVAAGVGTLTATAPGYRATTASVTPSDTFFTFKDLTMVSTAPFTIAATTPLNAATGFRVIDPVVLTFSRPADTASVRTAFSLRRVDTGALVPGTLTWANGNRRLSFQPAQTLTAFTQYEATVGAGATSPYGFAFDANGDGTPGDALAFRFTTGAQDITAPAVAGLYPANNGRNVEVMPLLSVTFDEEVVASSYQTSAITLTRTSDNVAVPLSVRADLVTGQTVLHLVPGAVLAPNSFYRLTLPAGMADRFGNAVPNARTITFQTGGVAEDRTDIEAFEGDFSANWWQPGQSGSTTLTSLVADSTRMDPSTTGNPLSGSTKSMQVRFGFKADASNWLIREYLNSGPAYNARFDTSYTLQTYVYGDGSGVLVRFAVDDGCSGASCAGTEVSPWTAVTWRGWRKVAWDLGTTPPGTWIGDGTLTGQLRVDSYQLSYTSGSPAFGRILFDDLAVVKTRLLTGTDEAAEAGTLSIGVAPNPVGTRATVRFTLAAPAPVTLAVYDALGRRVALLADGEALTAGAHERVWMPGDLAAGVYIVRLTAGGASRTVTAVVGR